MRKRQPTSSNENHAAYQKAFVRRVHQLLDIAYTSMKPVRKWGFKAEEDISGELARLIDEALDSLSQPWMKFFSLEAERHVDEPKVPFSKRRLGKKRRRMDFRFRCRLRKPVLRFVYEAKLLSDSGAYQDLIGENGLGRFLTKKYAAEDACAGLLGFVVNGNMDDEAAKVAVALKADPKRYRIVTNGTWKEHRWLGLSLQSHRTFHSRRKDDVFEVYHTFMKFY